MRKPDPQIKYEPAGVPFWVKDNPPKKYEPRVGPALRYIDPAEARRQRRAKEKALIDAANLTELQKFALMQMSAERRHQGIFHHGRLHVLAEGAFTGAAFYQLKDKGYAYKPEGKDWHILTDKGMALGNAVANELVETYQIHAMYIRHPRDDSMHSTFFCTCGFKRQLTIGGNMQVKAEKHFYDHLVSVRTARETADAVSTAPRQIDEG